MAPHIWSHHRSATATSLVVDNGNNRVQKFEQHRELHHPVGELRFSQFQFFARPALRATEGHAYVVDTIIGFRNSTSKLGGLHHEIRFARER